MEHLPIKQRKIEYETINIFIKKYGKGQKTDLKELEKIPVIEVGMRMIIL